MKNFLFLAILLPNILLGQHTIKGVFSPPEEFKFALLYKVTPTISVYVKNAEIKKDGKFTIKLDSTNTKGIYRLVYAIPQEDYNFDIIYNGKENIELTFNSETGVNFKMSTENKLLASYNNSMSKVTESIGNYFRQKSKDTLALNEIFKIQRETQISFEKAAKNTIALNFIKANKPYIPKKFEDVTTYSKNLKIHFFDAIDFNNQTLLSSNFITEKMLNYVFGVSADDKSKFANYKKNIDVFCSKLKPAAPKIKINLLTELWQQMADLGYEDVANYISDTYLMDITLALKDQQLANALIRYEAISIGSEAPDFSIEIKKADKKITQKLSELSIAENYIIAFWNTNCSHCLDEIPMLHSFIKTKESGKLKVIAVALEDDDKQWKIKTKSFPEFLHVLGLGKWENEIGNDYSVSGTPTYFILNKDKKIISKPEDFEVLKGFLSK